MCGHYNTCDVMSLPEAVLYEISESPAAVIIISAICIAVSVLLIKLLRKKK